MVWLRSPLFLLGLIYGTIINGCATSVCYGLIMIRQWVPVILEIIHHILIIGLPIAFIAGGAIGLINGIWQGLALSASLSIMFSTAFSFFATGAVLGFLATIAIFAAACLVTAALGFATGILYALTKGTWHCAMDFYNNGLTHGFTSPFRFLSAFWHDVVNHNRAPLVAYYESTDMGILEKRATAEKLFEHNIRETQLMVSGSTASKLPNELINMITTYTVDPTEISFPDTKGPVARKIEASDQKTIPISKYLTPEAISSVMKREYSSRRPPACINTSGEKKQQPYPTNRNV